MLNLSRSDLHNNVAFLHFLYLAKVNKERKYINRNGKMPAYAERNEPKKGYKSIYFITLRKFMEGYFSKTFKITKKKDKEEYTIESRGRDYTYGSSELIDSLVKIDLLRNSNALRGAIGNTSFVDKNHKFSFTSSLYQRRQGSSPFNLNYKFSFQDKIQAFAPAAFDSYSARMKGVATSSGNTERNAYADIISKGLTKLKAESFLRRKKRVNRATVAGMDAVKVEETAVRTPVIPGIVSVSGLSTKYHIPKNILDVFINSYKETMRQSSGLTAGAVFDFTKNVMQNEHNRIQSLDYLDFEHLVA
jgi:hypothetical protein